MRILLLCHCIDEVPNHSCAITAADIIFLTNQVVDTDSVAHWEKPVIFGVILEFVQLDNADGRSAILHYIHSRRIISPRTVAVVFRHMLHRSWLTPPLINMGLTEPVREKLKVCFLKGSKIQWSLLYGICSSSFVDTVRIKLNFVFPLWMSFTVFSAKIKTGILGTVFAYG